MHIISVVFLRAFRFIPTIFFNQEGCLRNAASAAFWLMSSSSRGVLACLSAAQQVAVWSSYMLIDVYHWSWKQHWCSSSQTPARDLLCSCDRKTKTLSFFLQPTPHPGVSFWRWKLSSCDRPVEISFLGSTSRFQSTFPVLVLSHCSWRRFVCSVLVLAPGLQTRWNLRRLSDILGQMGMYMHVHISCHGQPRTHRARHGMSEHVCGLGIHARVHDWLIDPTNWNHRCW